MKKRFLFLCTGAMLFAACNQPAKKEDHAKMHHSKVQGKNVMMAAMDEGMTAMHQAKQTGNADYDFASMMIPHHEGAIMMAEEILKNGKSPALIGFAKNVITAQQKEIKMLNDFLKIASQKPTKDAAKFKKALSVSMLPMMNGMQKVKLTNNVDRNFVMLMIPHHQSAVDMAKAYLPYSNNANIQLIAEQILKTQEEEINWLKAQ